MEAQNEIYFLILRNFFTDFTFPEQPQGTKANPGNGTGGKRGGSGKGFSSRKRSIVLVRSTNHRTLR